MLHQVDISSSVAVLGTACILLMALTQFITGLSDLCSAIETFFSRYERMVQAIKRRMYPRRRR